MATTQYASDGRVIVVSDWHLPADRAAKTNVFLRFTDEVCTGAAQVVVLGDLFHAWVGPRHVRHKGHAAALEALKTLATSGTRVAVMRGNRDFLLDRRTLRPYGLELVPTGWRTELHGRAVWLSHGDELTEDDRLHKVAKAILANFPVGTLVKALPLSVSDRLAAAYRWLSAHRRSRRKRKDLRPNERRIRAEFEWGVDVVVLGHWHRAGLETDAFGMPGKTLVRLGECTDSEAHYAEFREADIRLRTFPGH